MKREIQTEELDLVCGDTESLRPVGEAERCDIGRSLPFGGESLGGRHDGFLKSVAEILRVRRLSRQNRINATMFSRWRCWMVAERFETGARQTARSD